jgi:hypothetical protein
MTRRTFLAVVFILALLTAFRAIALASYRELKEPHLDLKDYPADDAKKLQAVLERQDCKFLGGAELNAASSLRYAGDTIALNRFIEALSLCPDVSVHINFYRPVGGAVECDWMVTQMAPSHELVVRINLASEHISMEKLYLPPVKAERPSE